MQATVLGILGGPTPPSVASPVTSGVKRISRPGISRALAPFRPKVAAG